MSQPWPPLPYDDWRDTLATVHRYTQIAGKISLALTPLVNHWWNVAMRVTSRGLATAAIPYEGGSFEIELDFVDHNFVVRTSRGEARALALVPRSVAQFYAEVMAIMAALGIAVDINDRPVEIANEAIPFAEDELHRSYDAAAAQRFWRVLVTSANVLSVVRAGFLGKSSPVQFFWGSFDLALSRFSGRRAPPRPGADAVTREAYSCEVISAGFWPGYERLREPAYYAYAAPWPAGLENASLQPREATFHQGLREFILPYEAVRRAPSPEQAVLDFCDATYGAAAQLAGWDRELVREVPPPPRPRRQRFVPRAQA
jgi:hypothetical protein